MKVPRIFSFLGFASVFALFLFDSVQAEDTVTLYTQRHYEFDEKLHEEFTEKTGIKVEVVKATADELIARLEQEGENSPADLFMTADAGGLDRASKAGLLAAMPASLLESVPDRLYDPESLWTAITQRARVLAYSKDRVKASDLSTYEALADAKWKGRLSIRSSSNIYNQSLMTTIIEANDAETAEAWAKAVRGNMARPPQGSDRDQIRAVAAGLADVALVNTYYVGLLENSSEKKDQDAAAAVSIFFPNQDGRGAHVNISGVGILKSSKNPEAAAKLIEFLLSPETQAQYPNATYEYPVVDGVAWSEIQERWGKFKADEVPLKVLGERNAEAVRLFNKAGWE